MVKMTIGACVSVLAALVLSLSALADDSSHWVWKYADFNSEADPDGNKVTWTNYCDTANWTQLGTGLNPYNRWPKENDILYYGSNYHQRCSFDMGGQDVTIYGIDDTYTREHPHPSISGIWGYHVFMVKNGSLTINSCCTNSRAHFNVWSGGSIKMSDNCRSKLGRSSASTHWYVHAGGYARLAGYATYERFDVDVFTGGSVEIDFKQLQRVGAPNPNTINNNGGAISMPNGLALTGTSGYGKVIINQNAGSMSIGGNVSMAPAGYSAEIHFAGGRIDFIGTSTLSNFSVAELAANCTGTVNVAGNRIADYRIMTLQSGSKLIKDGLGTLIIGSGTPAEVWVTNGVLGVVSGVQFGNSLKFFNNSKLRIYGSGTSANSIEGLDSATIEVDSAISDGAKVFSSTNPTLLSQVQAKLVASSGSVGSFVISGNDIVLHRAHAPSVFYWKDRTSNWRAFNDATYWGVGTTAAATNPDHLIPGDADWIHYMYDYQFGIYWDLQNMHHVIKGFDFTDWQEKGAKWGFHSFYIRNGTLEITGNFTNQRATVSLESNARFILGPNSATRMSQGDAQSWYTVKDGCEMILGGKLEIVVPWVEVFPGGRLSFEPSELTADTGSFKTGEGHPNPYFRNWGTMNFPNGFDFKSGGNKSSPGTLYFDSQDGVMTFDGPIEKGTSARGVFYMYFNGGEVRFNKSSDLRWFAGAGATNENSSATVYVASGESLNLPNGIYTGNAVLIKEGAGSISFGSGLPSNLVVRAGDVLLEGNNSVVDILEMPSGSTLTIAGTSTSIGTLKNIDQIDISIDVTRVSVGSVVLKSSNASLRSKFKAKAEASLPSGYYLSVTGDRLLLANDSVGYVFRCTGEKLMSDPSGWTSGTVAPAGADVYIKGVATVAVLDDTMNVYKSITVMDGATIKVKNLSSMPSLRMLFNSKFVAAEGKDLKFATDGIEIEGDASGMPTFEIDAGARVAFASGFEFKNLNLLLYGELKCEVPVYFGTANMGETTYFNLAATNATINLYHSGGDKEVAWMAPKAAGGRVVSPNGISLQHVDFPYDGNGRCSHMIGYRRLAYNSYVANPLDERFDFVLDDTRLIVRYNTEINMIGAGARIRAINGGSIEKAATAMVGPGTYNHTVFAGVGELTFENEGSLMGFYWNRYCVEANPDVDGVEQMTFRDGAAMRTPHFRGNGKAIYTFEDAFCDALELPDYDRAFWGGWLWVEAEKAFKMYNTGGSKDYPPGHDIPHEAVIDHSELHKYISPAFRGLKEVRIPLGHTLGFRGVNWRGIATRTYVANSEPSPTLETPKTVYSNEWDRVLRVDANVPLTGGGSIYVTNTVPDQSMTAVICCSSNTATGHAWAEADTIGTGNQLMFNDGANWAGTVVANGRLGFTNLVDGVEAARVTFNNISFEKPLDIRVWKDADGQTNDYLIVTSTTFYPGSGCLRPIPMEGYEPQLGDTFVIAQLPTEVPSMSGRSYLANRLWMIIDEVDKDSVRRLKIRYVPGGIRLNFRGRPPSDD